MILFHLLGLWLLNCVYAQDYLGSDDISLGFGNESLSFTDNVLRLSNSILNSDSVSEWTPIQSNIKAGSMDRFEFVVNSTSLGVSPSYEILIFLSGNICHQPRNTTGKELNVYYSFNKSILEDPHSGTLASFQNGYMEALAIRPLQDTGNSTRYSNLYLVIEATDTSESNEEQTDLSDEYWSYKISVSQNDLVFQWDLRPWLEIVDTDYNSALLVTGNVSTNSKTSSNYSIYDTSLYDIYVYSYDYFDYFDHELSHSLCAIKNGPYLVSSVENTTQVVGNSSLEIQKSITIRGGSVKEQFYITGLNSSTTYVTYLTKKVSKSSNSTADTGGVLFSKTTFTTMENDSCSLIFDMDFCDGVAYSVPTSGLVDRANKTLIAQMYDDIASSLYANFSKALQIIPCDTESDAAYSPLRTCGDCAAAYKNWLCAVSIPRCTTARTDYYIFRSKSDNRNDYLNSQVKPISNYYEILPCIDMCYSMVRDCPADFGFSCPNQKGSNLLYLSYNTYDDDLGFDTCNYVGNSNDLSILDDD